MSHAVRLAVLAGATLAAAANAGSFDWSFGEARLQYQVPARGPDGWFDYDLAPPQVDGLYIPNGIKLIGTGDEGHAFGLNGQQYHNPGGLPKGAFTSTSRLIISGTATFDGSIWQHPTDYISTVFKYGLTVTGGTVHMNAIETGFTLLDADNNFLIGVGSGTGGFDYTVGHTDTMFGFQDRFGSNYATGTHLDWTVAFYFDWSGADDNDTMEFFIPNNSIDIAVVPAPGAAALLGLSGLVAARRRR
ncbi:MAG: hypothetical protein U0570_10760 [Phycisphaerales bacterium]